MLEFTAEAIKRMKLKETTHKMIPKTPLRESCSQKNQKNYK